MMSFSLYMLLSSLSIACSINPKRVVPFSDTLHKAMVHKNLCVTGKKFWGKYFVKNGKENRQQ